MTDPNRRTFLSRAGTLALGASISSGFAQDQAAEAPAGKKPAPRFTIGLSQYSLRALLADKSLDALDYPTFAAEQFGIGAIDLWEGGLPKDKLDDPAYLKQMRQNARKAKTDLFLLMTGALDASAEKREASLAKLIPSILRAKRLGADFLRVFLKAPGSDEAAAVAASVEALKPLADAAGEKGIIVAIEPGASELSQKGAFLAKVSQQLKHEALTLMPDFGKQKDNIYDGTEAMLPLSKTISCKMHSFDEEGNQPDFDYSRLMKMIVESEYRGILAIEWEGSKLDPVAGVKASKALIEKSLAAAGVPVA